MKDEESFSGNEAPLGASAHQRAGESDGSARSAPPPVPQDAPAPAHPPLLKRQLSTRPHGRLLLVALLVMVLVVLAGGYAVFRAISPRPRRAPSAFQQAHCPFTLGQGLVEGKDVRCGFVVVPEDRSQPKSQTIRLAIAIFKTPNPHPAPDPVLLLGGGPGLPLLATEGPSITARNLTIFAPNRDLILLDQRGVGYSQPPLNCQGKELCAGEGINLNAYTTLESAADVHDVVRALGYTQVNLRGVSYGTRLALTVMRLYPADLRSVELISVIPPQVNDYTSRPQATMWAFDVLFQGCAANAHCNAAYPHLAQVFYRLVDDLNTQPITFQTPQHVPVRFSGDDLWQWLVQALSNTELIPLLPAVIFHVHNHDYHLLSRIYGTAVAGEETVSLGLHYSVECGEDMAYTTPQALTASVQVLAPELRPGMLASLLGDYRGCQFWNVKPVPAVQKEPVTSSIPTLILEGEYDPLTPPANGILTAQTLSRSFFFLFPGVSHGVRTTNPCPGIIGQAFLDHPTVKPNASCISSMPEPAFT